MSRLIAPGLLCVGLIIASTPPARAQRTSADYTAPHQRKALEIYKTIVGMRTAEAQGQVPAMAEYLAEQFRQGGFPAADVHVLRAGHAENALPQSATITVNCRIVPGEPIDEIKATLERVAETGGRLGEASLPSKKAIRLAQIGEALPTRLAGPVAH